MFKAGFARLDVTPPLGTYIAGYFGERHAKGIHDPIELNAIAFTDGEKTAAIVVSDFLGIMEEFATPIRKQISEATGVPADNLLLASIHAHTSIRLGVFPWTQSVNENDPAYVDVLCRKFADAVRIALDDMKEAKILAGARETPEQLAFIRRYRMKDGSTVTNPGKCNPDIECEIGKADNTVRVLRFKRAEGGDIALVSFSTHPDVIGGEIFSADWPGYVRRYVEGDLAGTHCVFLNGAQGDSNQLDTKTKAPQEGFEYSSHMGRVIADTAVSVWDELSEHKNTKIFSEVTMMQTAVNRSGLEDGEAKIAAYDNFLKTGDCGGMNSTQLAEARRLHGLKSIKTEKLTIPITFMGFGDIGFVGFGGEPFMEYAEKARACAPEMFLLAACCANGQQGYLPVESAFAEGGYEAAGSRFTEALPDDIMNVVKNLINKYKN